MENKTEMVKKMAISLRGLSSIKGYGVSLSGEIINLKKVLDLLEIPINEREDYKNIDETFAEVHDELEIDSEEIISLILKKKGFEKHSRNITYENTGYAFGGAFLVYTPKNAWEMTDEDKQITKEDIQKMIIEILNEVTNLTDNEIIDAFEEIALGIETQ